MMNFSRKDNCFRIINQKGENVLIRDKNIIFMNPIVMETLKYVKDDLVVLHTESGQMLFRCWPYTSLETSNLMLQSVNLLRKYLEGPVFCDHYSRSLGVADIIILNSDDHKMFMDSEPFRKFVRKQLDSVYVREDLMFSLSYLGNQCNFTVKSVYCHNASTLACEESLVDICTNISLLNITDNNSIVENSNDENSFTCSTPISSKNSSCQQNFHKKSKKKNIDVENGIMPKTQQFYVMHRLTKIIIKSPKITKSSHQDRFTLQNLGGLKEQISEMKSLIASICNQDFLFKEKCHGVILVGASGTGKTAIVHAIKNEFGLPLFNLNDAVSDSQTAEYELKKLYTEVTENSPCLLFLDDIDNLTQSNALNSQRDSKVALLSAMIHDLLSSRNDVLIIGTAKSIASVDASLRKPRILEKEIYFGMPSVESRKEILTKILGTKHHNISSSQITEIAEMAHGYSGGDLKLLCDKTDISMHKKKSDFDKCINFEDLKATLKDVKPNSMVEFMFEVPKVKWSDIGGMHAVKTAVTEMVEWPLKHSEQFKNFKIAPSRGILLYGPPGCSKTMIAKALASEGHLNFISVKGPQLFNKYVGESEKAVSALFKKARSAAPCVIFFDEIDSLTAIRGSISGNSNVAERVLTQLLVEIDGIDVLEGGVSIIAATNRPDMIDPSFLRPGRFDQMIYVPLPDYYTRKEIFESKIKTMPCASDIDIPYLTEATDGYTGAEITDVCREAAMSVIKEYISSPTALVTMLYFLTALKSVVPRTSEETVKFYENYNKRNLC